MAAQKRKNDHGRRQRPTRRDVKSRVTEGASRRETSNSQGSEESRNGAAGRYCSRIMTREELRQVIEAFATCCERFLSSPAKCDTIERGKDGIYSLHIMITFPPPKRSVSSSLSAQTENANSSTSLEYSASKKLRDSGASDGTSYFPGNYDDENLPFKE